MQLDVSKQHFNGLFTSECTHIPIFMAVQNMVMTGDTAMVRRCVAAGTDMNKSAQSYSGSMMDSGPPKWRLDCLEDLHRYTTPLVMLLSSVRKWDTDDRQMMDVVLRDLGVPAIDSPGREIIKPSRHAWVSNPEPHFDLLLRTYGGIPSPLEALFLLEYGGVGLQNLRNPEFLAVLRLVDEVGGVNCRNLGRLLVRADTRDLNVVQPWQKLLSGFIAPVVSRLDQARKDELLRRVVVDRAGLAHRRERDLRDMTCSYSKRLPMRIGILPLASIRMLLHAGANINDKESFYDKSNGVNCDGSTERRTPLQDVVFEIVRSGCVKGADCKKACHVYYLEKGRCRYTANVLKELVDFLEFLVADCGADPTVEAEAIDTLQAPLTGSQGDSKSTGKMLEGVAMALARALRLLKRGPRARALDSFDGEMTKDKCQVRSVGDIYY